MGLLLSKVFDPRDSLQRTRRKDLERLCKAHKVEGFREGMPADLMRRALRRAGVNHVHIPEQKHVPEPEAVEVDALDALAAEWDGKPVLPDPKDMTMPQLRKFCKQRGVKAVPTDRKRDLLAKLETVSGENAA